MKKNEIPEDEERTRLDKRFFEELKVINCSGQREYCTSYNGVNVTDLNIWDKALTSVEMISWTKCS